MIKEKIEKILRETLVIENKKGIPFAVEKLIILFNHQYCECKEGESGGETTEWTCNNCGKIVKEIK
jgi:hypothetical protein